VERGLQFVKQIGIQSFSKEADPLDESELTPRRLAAIVAAAMYVNPDGMFVGEDGRLQVSLAQCVRMVWGTEINVGFFVDKLRNLGVYVPIEGERHAYKLVIDETVIDDEVLVIVAQVRRSWGLDQNNGSVDVIAGNVPVNDDLAMAASSVDPANGMLDLLHRRQRVLAVVEQLLSDDIELALEVAREIIKLENEVTDLSSL